MAAAAAAAMLMIRVTPPRFSSSSSSFQSYPKASMQNTPPNNHNMAKVFNPYHNIPLSHKWTIPDLRHSFPPMSLPADSQSYPLTDEMGMKCEFEMKNLKHLLSETAKIDPLESLDMIDAIQRLGIDHCFKDEIESILQRQYTMENHNFNAKKGLHEVALRFRLLRQHGYFVPTDVLEDFIDKEGQLHTKFDKNIEGLMSLYEASQLCLPEDEKLEKIGNLSANILKTLVGHLDDGLAKYIREALANPFHKSLGKFVVKSYFGSQGQLQSPNKWVYVFQHMAKLDFRRVQKLYQRELSQFILWWKETDLVDELNFARDQPVKWYVASLVFLTDSFYSEQRIQLAKSISFVYLIDDIFDVLGALDELTLFTKAVCRWDLADAEGLPDCMQICLRSLFEVTNEISYQIYQKHGWNPIHSLHKAWAKLCKAFLVEAEWLSSGNSPSVEEYLENGVVTTGVHVTLIHVFFLLGEQISKETVDLFDDDLDIISSSSTVLRLWDDMGSAKDEKQEGRDGSYLEYYMKEHPSISYEETQLHAMKKISNAWKTLNRECLLSNLFPPKFNQACLNVARAVPMAYNYGRSQSMMSLENLIKQFLFHGMDM